MKPPDLSTPEKDQALDEAFLCLVDRVMLKRKQGDPFRFEQVSRALDEEVRLADLTGAHEPGPRQHSEPPWGR